jgi:isoleucyl-tRNA synthetase
MAPEFEAEILETLSKLNDRGFIQRGKRAIHWCPTDRTALAMAEIEYADVPSPSLFVRFPLVADAPPGVLGAFAGVSAIAWTTTPWTLPANLGLMVDPKAGYAVARAGSELVLVAKDRLAAVAERLGTPLEPLGTFPGASLVARSSRRRSATIRASSTARRTWISRTARGSCTPRPVTAPRTSPWARATASPLTALWTRPGGSRARCRTSPGGACWT